MRAHPEVTPSRGNVFSDLGLPNPEELLAKAELVRQISALIEERRLTQAEAAAVLGVDQPKVSALLRGHLSGFSTDRLLRFLLALGKDVTITIGAEPGTHACYRVRAQAPRGRAKRVVRR